MFDKHLLSIFFTPGTELSSEDLKLMGKVYYIYTAKPGGTYTGSRWLDKSVVKLLRIRGSYLKTITRYSQKVG